MNISPISMDTRIANIHYKDYRKKVRAHRAERLRLANLDIQEGGKRFRAGRVKKSRIEQEDETLMETYRALAQGMRIINVETVLRNAGLNSKQCPKLAVGRADWQFCCLTAQGERTGFSPYPHNYIESTPGVSVSKHRNGEISLPLRTFQHNVTNATWRKAQGYPELPLRAVTPAIPAHLRPEGDLKNYYVLWEAEWSHDAPVDPLLLRHISGFMFSVLAQWDLTPVERAVLEGRIA